MCILVLLSLCALVRSYSIYQDQIPNGHNVQHPCKSQLNWAGVGHFNVPGGGKNNPFGLDFKAEGLKWTPILCRKDSDQDGRTNGQELGDPDCVWTPGATPSRTENISHPGICQPFESSHCMELQSEDFKCSNYSCPQVDQPNVMKLDLKLPRTKVPAKENTLVCYTFNALTDNTYHAIALAPIEDNSKVAHHMLLFGCEGANYNVSDVPVECPMKVNNCYDALGGWYNGMERFCMPPDVGISIGKGYYTHFLVQIHWSNPEKRADYYDGSGITLYYTPHTQPIEGSFLTTGQLNLNIPPMSEEVVQIGGCSSDCTKTILPHPINITTVFVHMHYTATGGSFKLYRDGKLLRTLVEDTCHNCMYVLDPPVESLPGDRWETECIYQSNRNYTTYYGARAQDEMCYVALLYYPRIMTDACFQVGEIDMCNNISNHTECSWLKMDSIKRDILENPDFPTNCDLSSGLQCSPRCMQILKPLLDDPCMIGTIGSFLRHSIFRVENHGLMNGVLACDKGVDVTPTLTVD